MALHSVHMIVRPLSYVKNIHVCGLTSEFIGQWSELQVYWTEVYKSSLVVDFFYVKI